MKKDANIRIKINKIYIIQNNILTAKTQKTFNFLKLYQKSRITNKPFFVAAL